MLADDGDEHCSEGPELQYFNSVLLAPYLKVCQLKQRWTGHASEVLLPVNANAEKWEVTNDSTYATQAHGWQLQCHLISLNVRSKLNRCPDCGDVIIQYKRKTTGSMLSIGMPQWPYMSLGFTANGEKKTW